MIATPRVGQEVVVDFLHGDPDQPIIIGRTYHASNLPAIELPAAKTQMALRSKTHRGDGYNELKFEDARDSEAFSMRAQKDMNTLVLNNRTTTVKADHKETVEKNQTVNIGVDKSLTVGNKKITTIGLVNIENIGVSSIINVGSTYSLNTGNVVEIKCGLSTVLIDKDGNIKITGENITLQASGNVKVNGGRIDLN